MTGPGWCTATTTDGSAHVIHALGRHTCIHERQHPRQHRCACGHRWPNDEAVSA